MKSTTERDEVPAALAHSEIRLAQAQQAENLDDILYWEAQVKHYRYVLALR